MSSLQSTTDNLYPETYRSKLEGVTIRRGHLYTGRALSRSIISAACIINIALFTSISVCSLRISIDLIT